MPPADDKEAKDVEMKDAVPSGDGEEAIKAGQPDVASREPSEEGPALEDSRPKVEAGAFAPNLADGTLNALSSAGGKLLTTITEGGFQHLLAGVRATAGVKAGRYLFELRIVDLLGPSEVDSQSRGQAPRPHVLVRVGLSLAGSSLFLGDSGDSVCFDTEGCFAIEGKRRSKVAPKFGRGDTVGLLVNLDTNSPFANTVSLFKNGARGCPPQALPEALRGKVLFPTITYRGVTMHVNFGPAVRVPLPFSCRTCAEAAAEDVERAQLQPKEGKCEVLFPVGMPDQGYFDWVDDFVSKNPVYTELSDRKILDWAVKSGFPRPSRSQLGSKDRPEWNFQISNMDDMSIRRVLNAVTPVLKRNYVVVELKSNLLAADRKEVLRRFPPEDFDRKACVILGEPSAEYKAHIQGLLLAEKTKAMANKASTGKGEEKKPEGEEKKPESEEKKPDGEEKKPEGEEKNANGEEKTPEDGKDVKEGAVELTEEEKKQWYRKTGPPDMAEKALSKAYVNFTLPGADEGFDEVRYDWQPADASAKLLKDWVLAQKLTQRVEDLQPGASFKEAWSKWQKAMQEWRKRQVEWKDPSKKKALIAKKKMELAKKAEAEKAEKAKEEANQEKKEDAEMGAKDGAKDTEKGSSEKETAKEVSLPEINMEDLEPLTVEDIMDVGNGEPLFANFLYEDWALLSIRFELHILSWSFKKDLDDPDRPGFGERHLAFYYTRYFKKPFNLKTYDLEKLEDFVELIRDTITITPEHGFLQSVLAEDTPAAQFVRLTEDHRRDRERRLDAGDETAQLKFQRPAPPPRQPVPAKAGAAPPARPGAVPPRVSAPPARGGTAPPRSEPSSRGAPPSRTPQASASGRGPPPQHSGHSRAAPPSHQSSRYSSNSSGGGGGGGGGGSGGSSRPSHYGGSSSGHQSGSYSSHKRSYPPPSTSQQPSKYSRTQSYGGGGGSGYHRR